MLYEIMKSLNNFFVTNNQIKGTLEIKDSTLELPLVDGQYALIEGSTLNDGVYQYPFKDLIDETFDGCITVLAPPRDFLKLVSEIEDYQSKVQPSQYQSESFGGYSYTKATNASGNVAGWKNVFASRLNAYRKI